MASLKATMASGRLPPEDFEPPEGLVAVAMFDDFAKAGESGLAILAMGNAYWTLLHEGAYVLCVDPGKAEAVRSELRELAILESRRKRRRSVDYREFSFGWFSFLLYAVVLIGGFMLQEALELGPYGRVDALAMMDSGEWWRALSALTLHGDVVHLVSNLVAGMGFAFFVARFFGAAAGWLLILLSGSAGNALNAWVYYPEPHFSIGASTAVFGALGLLTGVGVWVALSEPEQRWTLPRWLVPVFGGLTLLGLIGVGDGLVDVAAHISGFFCGFLLGVVGANFQKVFARLERWGYWLGGLSLLLVVGAWVLALT